LAGVYIKSLEERFYPEHETAGGLIGYAEEGIGLAGIEAAFDTVLQHGEFRSVALPEVDFQGFNVKGNSRLDLVLTLDLEIQKTVDEQLRHYLKVSGAAKGLALLMDARTGAVIARSGQPSFNPNYFWQATDITHADMFSEVIDDKLYRRLLISGAAVYRSGEQSSKLLPAPVAAVDYGLRERELREYGQLIGLYEDMQGRLTPGNKMDPGENEAVQSGDEHKNVNGLQLITAVASMVNGGWRTTPFILDSVFDGAQKSFYTRSKEFDAKRRRRILSPSMGIMLRRNLGRENQVPGKDFFLYTDSVARIVKQGEMGRYIMQDMVIGAMPAKFPEMIMLMVAQRDHLNPLPKGLKKSSVKLVDLGRKLMPLVYASATQKVQRDYPVGLNSANYNQFLISHRIDFQGGSHATGKKGPVMPTVKGLSLRKGLQRLNGYNLQVRVEGSGRIIAQQPVPGKPLYGDGECVLFLESKI
jgi:cell division protein FtsI (penicillin-binding protein 3)